MNQAEDRIQRYKNLLNYGMRKKNSIKVKLGPLRIVGNICTEKAETELAKLNSDCNMTGGLYAKLILAIPGLPTLMDLL